MKRFVLGVIGVVAAGWLGCVSEPPPKEDEARQTAPEPEVSRLPERVDEAPYHQCVDGATCVFADDCPGAVTGALCGPGKNCCNPVGCPGACGRPSWCTAGNQYVLQGPTCPKAGDVCCVTILLD